MKPLPLDPGLKDVSPAQATALQAWGKGAMTPGQQQEVLSFILNDLCQVLAIDPPGLDERAAGFTSGQRRVGIVLANLTGARFVVPAAPKGD